MSDEDAARLRAAALAALARREHSRRDLQRKLSVRGFPAGAIACVLDELAAVRLQSDTRYAEMTIRSRAERGYGPRRIGVELKQHGTADELIRLAFNDVDFDWCALARQADHKKFGTQPGDSPETRAKRRRFLEYRGFDPEHIKAVLIPKQGLD
ncbi:MAG: regulatory protein RecX [Gammaproteobacteria bacterium]